MRIIHTYPALYIYDTNNNLRCYFNFCEYRTHEHLSYHTGVYKEQVEIILNIKNKEYRVTLDEFKTKYIDFLMLGKTCPLSLDIINEISNAAFYENLILTIRDNSRRYKTTDCWFSVESFNYHLEYVKGTQLATNYMPMDNLRIKRDNGSYSIYQNQYQNTRHMFYRVFEFEKYKNIEYLRYYIESLYKIIMPEQRWELINLTFDYMFAGRFKQYFKVKYGDTINTPILVVTGPAGTGKGFIQTKIFSMYYSDDSQCKLSQNTIEGSSPLSRMPLGSNFIGAEKIFDEIKDPKSLLSIFNNYLTDGYFWDSINIGSQTVSRYFYPSFTIITNELDLALQNGISDASNDRIVNYEMSVFPIKTEEMDNIEEEFKEKDKNNKQVAAATLEYLYKKYDKEIKEYIDKRLKEDNIKLSDMKTIRDQRKTRLLLAGMYIREFLNQTEELKDAFKQINDLDYYKQLVSNKNNKRIKTHKSEIQAAINLVFAEPIYAAGNKIYFTEMLNDIEYNEFYKYDLQMQEFGDIKHQKLMKFFYYLTNELQIYPSTEYGYFIISKHFLHKVGKKLSKEAIINKQDFIIAFDKYIRKGKDDNALLGTTDCYNFTFNDNEFYTINKIKKSEAIKFNLKQFIEDWNNE